VNIEQLLNRRARHLHVSTRSDIVASIVAALFLVAVLAWRLPSAGFALPTIGIALAALWIAITVLKLRRLIRGTAPQPDTASTGIAYYRRELEIRRDHLRNAWLWHGPLLLAAVLFVASFAGRGYPGMDRFRSAAPLFAILVLWVAVATRRRFRQAADIEREIDEIARLERG
jgi:hypothetical protein